MYINTGHQNRDFDLGIFQFGDIFFRNRIVHSFISFQLILINYHLPQIEISKIHPTIMFTSFSNEAKYNQFW